MTARYSDVQIAELIEVTKHPKVTLDTVLRVRTIIENEMLHRENGTLRASLQAIKAEVGTSTRAYHIASAALGEG